MRNIRSYDLAEQPRQWGVHGVCLNGTIYCDHYNPQWLSGKSCMCVQTILVRYRCEVLSWVLMIIQNYRSLKSTVDLCSSKSIMEKDR